MGKSWAVVLAAVAALGAGCDGSEGSFSETLQDDGSPPPVLSTEDAAALAFETELIRLVNDYRVSRGLNALIDMGPLRDVARAHSRHMIERRFFAHASPEGLTAGDRFGQAQIPWAMTGENIAAGYATAREVFEAWLASPVHRAVLDEEGWMYTGAGYAEDAFPTPDFPYTHYWTQNFLRP